MSTTTLFEVPEVLPLALAACLAAMIVFMMPGLLVYLRLGSNKAIVWLDMIPISWTVSLALWGIPAIVLRLHISGLALGYATISLLCMGLVMLAVRHRGSCRHVRQNPRSSVGYYALIVIVVGIAVLTLAGIANAARDGDDWSALANMTRYLIAPDSVFPQGRLEYTSWLPLTSLLTWAVGISPFDLLNTYLPLLIAPIAFLAFTMLARRVTSDAETSFFVLGLFLVSLLVDLPDRDSEGYSFLVRLAQDKMVVRFIIYPVSMTLLLRYLDDGNKSDAGLACLASLCASLVHQAIFLILLLNWAGLLFVHYVVNPNRSTLVRVIRSGALLVPGTLFAFFIWLQSPMEDLGLGGTTITSRSMLHLSTVIDHRLFFWDPTTYSAHPALLMKPIPILGLIFLIPGLSKIRSNSGVQFAAATMLLPLALIYIPYTAGLLGRVMTPWLLYRVTWQLPSVLIIGWTVSKSRGWLASKFTPRLPWLSNTESLLLPLSLTVITAFTVWKTGFIPGLHLQSPVGYDVTLAGFDTERSEVVGLVNTYVPKGAMVLVENHLATPVRALSPVETPVFRGVGMASEVNAFYEPGFLKEQHLHLLEDIGADFVLVRVGSRLESQLNDLQEVFSAVASSQLYSLFRVKEVEVVPKLVEANTAMSAGRLHDAIQIYQSLLVTNPDLLWARLGLAQTLWQQRNLEAAREHLRIAVSSHPLDAWPHAVLGYILAAEGRKDEALVEYEQAVDLYQYDKVLFVALGNSYVKKGDSERAYSAFSHAVSLGMDCDQGGTLALGVGELFKKAGDVNSSIGQYRIASSRFLQGQPVAASCGASWFAPSQRFDMDAWIRIGVFQREQQNFEEAEFAFTRAAKADPWSYLPHFAWGDLLYQLQEYEQAIQHYRRAAFLNWLDSTIHTKLAEAYVQNGQWKAAITEYKRAAATSSGSTEPLIAVGDLYMAHDDPVSAARAYQEVVERYPRRTWLRIHKLANAYMAAGQYEDAITQYQEALRWQSGSIMAWLNISDAYLALGFNSDAISAIENAIQLDHRRATPYRKLMAILEETGELEGAIARYQNQIETNPDQPWPYLLLAHALIALDPQASRQEYFDATEEALQRALVLDPENVDGFIILARLYQRTNHLEEAVTAWRQVESLSEGDTKDMAQNNLNRLAERLGREE